MLDNTMQTIGEKNRTVRILLPYLAILATLYTIYFAKFILLPIVVAAFFALFTSPLVARLERLFLPRAVSAIIVLLGVIGALSFVAMLFTNPAQQWWDKLPEVANSMSSSIGEATQSLNKATSNGAAASNTDIAKASENIRNTTFLAMFKSFASSTPLVLTQILGTIFLIYFFLVHGQVLLLRFVQARSSFSDKRQAVELLSEMQQQLSRYVTTITCVNIALGFCVGCAFYIMKVEDPFLWGALAGALNFAPYLGPLVSATAFALVAYLQFNQIEMALLIPGVYLLINLIESQFVTPTLLGSTLNLNPLVVFVWLVLWGWLWGGFGMLVGVPLLVCLSIYLEHTRLIGDWHILIKQES